MNAYFVQLPKTVLNFWVWGSADGIWELSCIVVKKKEESDSSSAKIVK